jgi:hypothetical protein
MRFLAAILLLASALAASERAISVEALRDKIAGGWAGQMIGVSYGAPTEFRYQGKINDSVLPKWTPDRVSNSLEQDDLYVDMTFAGVLDRKGLGATTADFGDMFREAKYNLWHANLAARRNLRRGVPAEQSGLPKYNAHSNDIDFQIESDFIGLMAPGLYQSANDLALRAGRVMNSGDGIYGGMFVSCMYASAFFEGDPRKVVEAGLACIPRKSPYGMLIADLLAWSKQYPDDWRKVWQLLEDKWDRNDPCPEGALKPFNIDAKLNGGYIALGLLYGKRDFGRTIEIATRSGQDSDCNPASAGGILGVMLGYAAIPEEWKGGIPAIADRKFSYTDFSFHTIVASTEKRAIALVEQAGGRLEGDRLVVKEQTPKPVALPEWNYGTVAGRVKSWTFSPTWPEKGAEASIAFSGTGAIVVGPYVPHGGKADVYLDGKLDRTVDVDSDEDNTKNSEAVWHAFGLKDGNHTLRVVVREMPVAVQELVVFR